MSGFRFDVRESNDGWTWFRPSAEPVGADRAVSYTSGGEMVPLLRSEVPFSYQDLGDVVFMLETRTGIALAMKSDLACSGVVGPVQRGAAMALYAWTPVDDAGVIFDGDVPDLDLDSVDSEVEVASPSGMRVVCESYVCDERHIPHFIWNDTDVVGGGELALHEPGRVQSNYVGQGDDCWNESGCRVAVRGRVVLADDDRTSSYEGVDDLGRLSAEFSVKVGMSVDDDVEEIERSDLPGGVTPGRAVAAQRVPEGCAAGVQPAGRVEADPRVHCSFGTRCEEGVLHWVGYDELVPLNSPGTLAVPNPTWFPSVTIPYWPVVSAFGDGRCYMAITGPMVDLGRYPSVAVVAAYANVQCLGRVALVSVAPGVYHCVPGTGVNLASYPPDAVIGGVDTACLAPAAADAIGSDVTMPDTSPVVPFARHSHLSGGFPTRGAWAG